MIESTESFVSSVREMVYSAGELLGVFGMGILIGLWTMIKKKKISIISLLKKEKNAANAHTQVHETLTELRILIRASRTLVFQFHNGGKFADGSSIKRFSVTHESCGIGVQSMLLESQDVLVTRYKELVDSLEHQENQIIKVSDLPQCSFRYGMEINNVLFFSVSRLHCEDGLTPMGFVCCHWCDFEDLDSVRDEGIPDTSLSDVVATSSKTINSHLMHGNH